LYDGLCPCNPNSKQSLHHYISQADVSSANAETTQSGGSSSRRRLHRHTGRFLSVSLQQETAVYFSIKRAVEDGQFPARVVRITLHLNEGEYLKLYGNDDHDHDDSVTMTSDSCDSSEDHHHHYHNGHTTTTLYHVPSVARQEKWTGLAMDHAQEFDEICLTRPIPASDIDKVIILTEQDMVYFVSALNQHHHSCSRLLDSFAKFCKAYSKWPGRFALSDTRFEGQRLRIVEVTTKLVVKRREHQRHVQKILNDGGLVAISLDHEYNEKYEGDTNENDLGHVVVYGQSRNQRTHLPIGYICPQHARIFAPHHFANFRYRRYELPFQQSTSSSPLPLPPSANTNKLTLLLQMSLRDAKHVAGRIEMTKIGSASIHFPDGPSFLSPGSL
jgi:hypothetical protein